MFLEEGFFGGAVDLGAEVLEIEGFFDVVVGALSDGSFAGGDVGVCGDEEDGWRGVGLPGDIEQLEAIAITVHDEVGDDDVVGFVVETGAGIGEAIGEVAAVSEAFEGIGHDLGMVAFIIDDEYMGFMEVRIGDHCRLS